VERVLLAAHFEPELYLQEARLLAASGAAHAAIDLSDGLASDLRHVCRASGVGAIVDETSLPLSPALRQLCAAAGRDLLRLALGGGEDYRLLVAVDPSHVGELQTLIAERTCRTLFDVGEIVAGDSIRLRSSDGSCRELELTGFDHFAAGGAAPAGEGA
jgi:thiamine-monophosphate kinase